MLAVFPRRNPGVRRLSPGGKMDIGELKKQTSLKVLSRGKSGTGKTRLASLVALGVLEEGYSVLYIDTETEGATNMVTLIDKEGYDDDVVENLTYLQVSNYEGMKSSLNNAEDYDLVVFDTLDHKHSFVLKAVTDAKRDADADWNEYPQIYSEEKEFMTDISNVNTNVLATIDPESGKSSKPKGTQVNIHGYFSVVVDLYRDGDSWSHKIDNWIGRSDLIGKELSNVDLHEALLKEVLERL
jgi:hypothetical protein